jgi:hypothetical protein
MKNNINTYQMALINCPECKKEVSDKAKSCPNCGCPISEKQVLQVDKDKAAPEIIKPVTKKSNKSSFGCVKIFVIILLIIFIYLMYGVFRKNNNPIPLPQTEEKYSGYKTQKKEIIYKDGIACAEVLSKDKNSARIWTYEEIDEEDSLQKIIDELNISDINTIFMYSGNNTGGDSYYAFYDKIKIRKKVSDEEMITRLINEINDCSKISLVSFNDVQIFLVRVDKYNDDIRKYSNLNKDVDDLKKALSSYQKKQFPDARKAYTAHSKKELWKKNIEASSSGRQITYAGYMFADNGTIKATFKEISGELKRLRFNRVNFKWADGQNYTYYDLDSMEDDEVLN